MFINSGEQEEDMHILTKPPREPKRNTWYTQTCEVPALDALSEYCYNWVQQHTTNRTLRALLNPLIQLMKRWLKVKHVKLVGSLGTTDPRVPKSPALNYAGDGAIRRRRIDTAMAPLWTQQSLDAQPRMGYPHSLQIESPVSITKKTVLGMHPDL